MSIDINEVDWDITTNPDNKVVKVVASIGDLTLGTKRYKSITEKEAKRLATAEIKTYGSLL